MNEVHYKHNFTNNNNNSLRIKAFFPALHFTKAVLIYNNMSRLNIKIKRKLPLALVTVTDADDDCNSLKCF